jgi:hypothetical protein
MGSILAGPHYEISSSELAAWLEKQGEDRYWYVDGDPLLTGRLSFPCPGDELATELRKINRQLLVQAKEDDAGARGQVIDVVKLDSAVAKFRENHRLTGPTPRWAEDRVLYLCWSGSPHEWLLVEDSATTAQNRADEIAQAK